MDWCYKVVCCDEDLELFFLVGNSGLVFVQIVDVKLVCNWCLVIIECFSWVLNIGQDLGVWGGMSEDEWCVLKCCNVCMKVCIGV